MKNDNDFIIAQNEELISFDSFIRRLFELKAECNHEHYYCEVFVPFLKSCCIEEMKLVPVFDDRATGPKSDRDTEIKLRMKTISACKDDGKYTVPDYIYVPKEYSFENPMKPYLMVETKNPVLIHDGMYYRDLGDFITENESEIRAEIKAVNHRHVLFTDGLTWMFLTVNANDKIVESETYRTIRLINKLEKYHKTNKIELKNQKKIIDLSIFGLGSFEVVTEPEEWEALKQQIKDLLEEVK